MKKTILILYALLVTITLFAQPAAWLNFPPSPTPNANGSLQGDATINGVAAEDGDFVAAFTQDGVLVGVGAVGVSDGTAFFSMVIYEKDDNNPDLMMSGENFNLRIWDATDGGQYYYGGPDPIGPYTSSNGAPIPNLMNQTTMQAIDNGFFTNTMDFSAVLPVELASLELKKRDCGVHELIWSTASELNSDYFTIERSVGNINKFEEIGTVTAAGNSQTKLEYSFTDEIKLQGKQDVYYRLSQTDFDGSKDVFNMLYVKYDCGDDTPISFYPNPVKNNLNINIANAERITIKAYNTLGQQVLDLNANDQSSIDVNVDEWNDGMYMINVYQYDELIETKKIIKN